MKLSVVIITRNRAEQLRQTLGKFPGLKASFPWELLVVDNFSTDRTQEVLREFAANFSGNFRCVIERKPGAGHARNQGWKSARGNIVAYLDDDCYPGEDYLEAVHRCFAEDDRLGFLGGRLLLFDPTDYPITIKESQIREDIEPGHFISAGLIHGANCAFRKTALESVSGYDPRFGPGALFVCEDVDVVARISGCGWHGAYDPRPIVYHHHRRKNPQEIQTLIKQYDRGRGAYYAKCILDRTLRRTYLKSWYWNIRQQRLGTTFREIIAGAEFLLRSLFHKGPGPDSEVSRKR